LTIPRVQQLIERPLNLPSWIFLGFRPCKWSISFIIFVFVNDLFILSGKEMDICLIGGEKEGLYPIQALVQPIALRFKYHFESARQTNKLEKVRKSFVCASSIWP
jgi:hypothetical protein